MRRHLLAVCLVFAGSFPICAGEEPAQKKTPEESQFTAPSPQPATSDYLPYYLPNSLPKPGTREVWQYYGVDSRGRWVPRVIQSPYGSYYLYNGAPFPYPTTQRNLYMPYVVD